MNNVIDITSKQDYTKLAVEKIAAELKDFKGDRYGMAVKDHVASTLTHFCEQDRRFAEVVYKTKRTLSDCCAAIMKGCGNSISDIDVYRGAVRHYFPNSDIEFHMTISLTGDAPSEEEMSRDVKKPEPKKQAAKKPAKAAQPTKPAAAPPEKVARPKPTPAPKPAKAPKKSKEQPQSSDFIQLSIF